MTDVEDVIAALFRPPGPESAPRAGVVERLDNETFHVDYHDPEHVYLVAVQRVPRIRLPLARPVRVGSVGGVHAELVQVSVANHIEVTLDAEHGRPRETGLSDFLAAYQQWEQRAERGNAPPPWPAEQLNAIALAVSDDVGTPYRLASGQLGGVGTEWAVHRGFRPPPPATARRLTLDFTSPDGPPARIDLPLPPAGSETP